MIYFEIFILNFAELDVMKKQAEVDKKQTDELVRERDILNKNLLKVSFSLVYGLFTC